MKLFITAIISTLLSLGAVAQTTSTAAPAAATATASSNKELAEAEVRKIDKDAKKITLKHGPIKSLDMPSMTMVFQVRDIALLEKIAVGDKILFTAAQMQGAYVMTSAEKASAP